MKCFRKKKQKTVPTAPGTSSSAAGGTVGPPHTCCCCCKANVRGHNGVVHVIGSDDIHVHVLPQNNHPPSISTSIQDGQFLSKRGGTLRITDSDSEKGNPCFAWMSASEDSGRIQGMRDEDRGDFESKEKLAYMPVSKNDPHYNMNHPRRGKAVIFNFDHWDNTLIPELGLSPRKGSEKDKNDLAKTLEKLDFEVHPYESCGSLEMWDILYKLRDEDHTDADCLVVCIMTHGERNTVFVRDGTQIPVNLIWEAFEAHKCPSLAGKPKIFIIQACRGKSYDSGTLLSKVRQLVLDESIDVTDSSAFSYVIPNSADFLIAFSCPLGHYSWRNPQQGSWFIQSICKIFDQHADDMDIQHLFTEVARDVALNYESSTTHHASDKKKQVTSTSSTLIRKVIFKPKPKMEDSNLNYSATPITMLNENGITNGDDKHNDDSIPSGIWTESQI